MGIKGFPTLKIVRPGKKAGRPVVDDYQGPRTAAGIVDAVIAQINNHVSRVTDNDVDAFLTEAGDGPKALLFTDKGTTSPLLKSIAIDFLGVIAIGQVRNKESETVVKFGVDTFPTLVLLPGDGKDPIVYEGEMKRDPVVAFLSQAGAPNKAAPPSGGKASAKKDKKDKKEKKEKKEKKKEAKPEPSEDAESETKTTSTPTEQQTAPVLVESALPIPTIHTPEKLNKECLNDKAHTCVLAFVTSGGSADEAASTTGAAAQVALDNLAELAHKYSKGKRHMFPFYAVPTSNTAAAEVLKALDLDPVASGNQVHLVAINARRGWWRHFEGGDDLSHEAIESWIDAIRMSEGVKKKLPEGLVAIAVEEASEATSATSESAPAEETPAAETPSAEASSEAPEAGETPKAEPEEIKHEEL